MSLLPAAARTPISLCLGGSFWNGGGSCLGDLYLSLLEFSPYHLYQYGSGSVGAGADSGGESSFPCSAQHFMVLAGPFLLPRTLWPGMNMMMVAIIFGILVAHIYNELFLFVS